MARDDAAYALAMVERPEASRAELRTLVRKLADAVTSVASVAELPANDWTHSGKGRRRSTARGFRR